MRTIKPMFTHKVVRLEQQQIPQASEIAAKAFENDPVFSYLTPLARKYRLKALTWLAKNTLEYCYRYGHIYTTPDIKGIAAWLPPEQSSFTTIQLLKLILQLRLYLLPFNCGWNKLGRWLSFSKITEKYHDRDMATQSHWYLALMFVNPSYQRQGVGSALLEPILDRAKNEKLPCYLVTFTEQAVNFYQKNGFKTIRKSQHGSGISRGFLGISSRQSAKDAPYFWNLKRDSA